MLPPPLPLSLCLSGLRLGYGQDISAATLRDVLPWIVNLGCRAVQLSATASGLKPRELDRSARRDLAAVIRRVGLTVSGVDCLVPPEHFAKPEHQDRAVAAVGAACEFASEMASLLPAGYPTAAVTLLLHKETPEDVQEAMAGHAEREGCVLCELNWPLLRAGNSLTSHQQPRASSKAAAAAAALGPRNSLAVVPDVVPDVAAQTATAPGHGPFRMALDPAALLMGGLDPLALAARMGARLSHARLSDVSTAGRIAPGSPDGRLDLMGYAVALSAAQYNGPLVLDLRTVHDQAAAAQCAVSAWLSGNSQLSQFR